MTLALTFTLIGIAIMDSLNPSLFVAQFYLLTTEKPIPRILAYMAGVIVVNFLGGVLILAGARELILRLVESVPLDAQFAVQIALGAALILFGVLSKGSAAPPDSAKPRSMRPIHTFLLGMVVMVNELTTALPYFLAIERIVGADLTTVQNLIALVVYNFVFALPLFAFLGAYVISRARFTAQIERISVWISRWMPRLIKYGALFLGVYLVVDGVGRLI